MHANRGHGTPNVFEISYLFYKFGRWQATLTAPPPSELKLLWDPDSISFFYGDVFGKIFVKWFSFKLI